MSLYRHARAVAVFLSIAIVASLMVSASPASAVSADFVVAAGSDDAEEGSTGSMYLTSSDLELVDDGGIQTVGIRFTGISIPRGTSLTNAYVQFTADEVTTGATSLSVAGQAIDNAPTFTSSTGNVSSRAKTSATVAWNPAPWPTINVAGVDQRTPDLSSVVQQIVNRTGWSTGNALAVIITGNGVRTAEAFEGTAKAKLHVEYTTSAPANTAPVVSAGPDQTVTLPAAASLNGSVTDDGLPAGSTTTSQWTTVSGPGTVTFASSTSPTTTATFDTPGTYVLRLTATDTQLTAADDVTVNVVQSGPNAAPSVNAGPDQTITTGLGAGLPGPIEGVMPEGHGHIGPYIDSNGNIYTVVEDFLANGNRPRAMKSADGGRSWNEIDAAGRPTTGDLEGDWLVQVGTTIYFAFQKSSGHIYLTAFNTSDAATNPDKWVIQRQLIHLPSTKPINQYVSIAPLSNGDIWAFYATEPSGALQQVGYRIRSASTGLWGPQVLLDPTRNVGQVVAIRGDNDKVHIVYKDHTAQHILYRSLTSSGQLSAAVQVDRSGVNSIHSPMTNPLYYNAAGTERVTIAWADAAKILKSTVIDNEVPSTEQTLSDLPVIVNPGITTNVAAVAHLALDGTTVHALYADLATQDIWHDVKPNGASWGTDVEIDDNLTTQWITGLNVYNNPAGQRVLAYVYDTGPHGDDGGIIRYDELLLGGASSQGIAQLNGSVTDDGQPNPPGVTTRQWTVVSGPGTVTFGNSTAPSTTATFSLPGTYVLRLTASDSALSASDDITVTVVANAAPVVDAGPDQNVTLPAAASLSGSVTDDGYPNPPGATSSQWTKASGPGTVTFGNATSLATTANFSDPGTYVLRLTGSDTELAGSDDVTVTVSAGSGQIVSADFLVAAGSDDAEEASTGSMSLSSSDLELVNDGGAQTVGIRFTGVSIPLGATITNAYVQFTADEVTTGACSLIVAGQAIDNAPTFSSATANISSRARTGATVAWNPAPWSTIDVAGVDQRTPTLIPVVQQIVNRTGWSAGNALAVIITGSGVRTAEAFEGTAKAKLHVEYTVG